ncbi:MAG TPA: TetR family transcriptional regulator [Flavipsychrobacter sp.]|nr:TetR family transcriptional regulator [Flavipsychrobacter sp.]
MATKNVDKSTEEKIITAARKVFTEKGYAATRTRDIAEVAGINLALLNYYFRSKEKLFDLIMMENLHQFMAVVKEIVNDQNTSLDKKLETIAANYIDLLTEQPNLPLFILTEMRHHPQKLVMNMDVKKTLQGSALMKQLAIAAKEGKGVAQHPLHLIMNLMGMIIFPFIASPILLAIGDINDNEFKQLMLKRKKLIPIWIKAILKST